MVTSRPIVALLHPLPEPVEAALATGFELLRRRHDDDPGVGELVELAGAADAIVSTVTDALPATVFRPGRRLRMVANFGVGYERIDLAAARAAGVTVTNTPGVLTECTADLTLALILMALRRAGEGERRLRAGQWTGWRPTAMLGRRVTGRTLGIVGMGRIGLAVARRARHGFGMAIRYHTRSPLPSDIALELGAEPRSLERLLTEVDVLTLHCPLTSETALLIDRDRLALLGPGAVLINAARGGLVDEAALVEALRAGRLAAAGLDVFEGEPDISPALLELENAVLLPHLGSATVETRTAMGMKVVANLEAFFDGRPVPDPVTG